MASPSLSPCCAVTIAKDRFAAGAATVTTAHGGFRLRDPLFDGPAAHGVGLGLLSIRIGGPADAAVLRALGRDATTHILQAMVWAPLGAAKLPSGPDLALFAYAVEAGTLRAVMELQAELGVETGGAPDVVTLARNAWPGAVRPSRAHRVASDRTEFAPAGGPVRPSPPWQTALGRPAYPREILGR